MSAFINSLKNYAKFSGRATRYEYWMTYLFYVIFYFVVSIVGGILSGITNSETIAFVLIGIYGLALFIPMLAVQIRRLHDIGKSGWWYFISFIPCIGGIWLLVLNCTSSDGPNQYD